MSTFGDWSRAYARQAQADLECWQRFDADSAVQTCHRLLLLQMACEKLTKAHLCTRGSDPRDLARSHAYIAKNPANDRAPFGGDGLSCQESAMVANACEISGSGNRDASAGDQAGRTTAR